MRQALAAGLCLLLCACGGGGGGSPTSPSGPTGGSSDPGSAITGFVFYDENGNGMPDSEEVVRLPGVSIQIGGRTARSEAAGRFVVERVPAGSQSVVVPASGMPAFFAAGASLTVQAPQAGAAVLAVPLVSPIDRNLPNVYLAFGDSITSGDGSSDQSGYVGWLKADLTSYWGRAAIANDGDPGTKSDAGANRIAGSIRRERPAYTLILYGTNDWNRLECKDERFPCDLVENLRAMIQVAKGLGSHPVVSTIIPANPTFGDREAAARNEWVRKMNDLIKPMVRSEGAALADGYAAMADSANLAGLFSDHIHPNDDGYRLLAQAFFRAITNPAQTP